RIPDSPALALLRAVLVANVSTSPSPRRMLMPTAKRWILSGRRLPAGTADQRRRSPRRVAFAGAAGATALVLAYAGAAQATPAGPAAAAETSAVQSVPPACPDGSGQTPLYRDTSYPFAERAADLVSCMTLAEKVAQLKTNSAPAIPRLGVQQYTY